MPRLPRPHIPLEVRYRVALRQLGYTPEMIDHEIDDAKDQTRAPRFRGIGRRLNEALVAISTRLACTPADLRLDHDDALENREKRIRMPNGRTRRVIIVPPGAKVLRYFPDANDPEHLVYREKHAHHIKTNIRGDGAQFADNVIAKRERRRAKKQKRVSAPKFQQAKRKIQNRGFPPKGSRSFTMRRKP